MANSSESLRRCGLSLLYSHLVLLTRTRACQLEPPPKSPPVARWKLIRPQKEVVVSSEPQKIPLPKPEQFIEVASPFLSYHFNSTSGSTSQLEAKQSTPKKHFPSSPLVSVIEKEETKCQESFEPNAAKGSTDSPSNPDKTQVTAEDKKKGNDDISNDRPTSAIKDPITEESFAEAKPILKKTWVDLDGFAKCFQTLLVFHKPHTYPHQIQKSHFKSNILPKTTGLINCPGSSSNGLTSGSQAAGSLEFPELRNTYFLCVDSLQPCQILISFSALLLWGDAPEENKEMSRVRKFAALTILPHSWTSLQSQLPVLTIKTTCSKAAVLNLPTGRHVLRVLTCAALGCHVHLCSRTPFIFGDEELIMKHLTKESSYFTEQASSIFMALSRMVASFSDEELPVLRKTLEKTHCPPKMNSTVDTWKHYKVFKSAVYHMACEALGRKLTSEEEFAVQALTTDPSFLASDQEENSPRSVVEDTNSKPPDTSKDILPACKNDQSVTSPQEVQSATKPGTKENLSACNILLAMWQKIEADAEKHAVFLLRYIIENSEKKADLYPCLQDESTRIAFADYSVCLQETSSLWVLVFREVFLVPKEMLLVPKVYSPVSNCVLHVINNDTGEEMGMIFNRVAPRVYQPNKCGYTFVAEVFTSGLLPAGASWKLRLIGTKEPLPKLCRKTPLNAFSVKEFQDYYIPNDKNIICSFHVQVTTDSLGTIQFQTSNPDVLIRLSILDQGKEVAGNTGTGHVLIPTFQFLADEDPSYAEEKNQMESSIQDAPQQRNETENIVIKPDSSSDQHEPLTKTMGHKYVVQAEVLCKSWDLDESLVAFACTLKDMEKKEMRVSKPEELNSPSTTNSPNEGQRSNTSKIQHKGKVNKENGKRAVISNSGHKQEKSPVLMCPNWTLRVVTDKVEGIEVKRDTERKDQIIAIQNAWEMAEPGRRVKASQSRIRYLNQIQHIESDEATSDESKDHVPSRSGQDVCVSESSKKQTDVSRFFPHLFRCQKDVPELLDSQSEEAQQMERIEKIQTYRLVRESVLEHHEQMKSDLKEEMRRQLEMYENMQAQRQDFENSFHACKAFSSLKMAAMKKEQEEKQALEEAQLAVQKGTGPTSAATRKPNKHAKSARKKK